MINVGVVGLGMMGLTHLDVYSASTAAKVVAVADADPGRRSGTTKARGNVEGQAQGRFDVATVTAYADGLELIRDPNVRIVDVCLPTPLHKAFAIAALEAGKHVLVEKPLARTSADALAIADAADAAYEKCGAIAMPAMCMRFWPGWTWLKRAVDERTYGRVLSAKFTRLASHPGGNFYQSAEASGAAALDLHIHDTDFVKPPLRPPVRRAERRVFRGDHRRRPPAHAIPLRRHPAGHRRGGLVHGGGFPVPDAVPRQLRAGDGGVRRDGRRAALDLSGRHVRGDPDAGRNGVPRGDRLFPEVRGRKAPPGNRDPSRRRRGGVDRGGGGRERTVGERGETVVTFRAHANVPHRGTYCFAHAKRADGAQGAAHGAVLRGVSGNPANSLTP